MNMSVLSTQDSNNQKKKDSLSGSNVNKSTHGQKYEDRQREKRTHTETSKVDESKYKQNNQNQQMRRDPSYKKR